MRWGKRRVWNIQPVFLSFVLILIFCTAGQYILVSSWCPMLSDSRYCRNTSTSSRPGLLLLSRENYFLFKMRNLTSDTGIISSQAENESEMKKIWRYHVQCNGGALEHNIIIIWRLSWIYRQNIRRSTTPGQRSAKRKSCKILTVQFLIIFIVLINYNHDTK